MMVVAPPAEEPKVMLVEDPDSPPVPKFIAFVLVEAVAPVAMLYVELSVDDVNIFTVCGDVAELPIERDVAAPKALTVVAVVLKTSIEAPEETTLVVKDGDVPNTREPDPVSSVIAAARLELDGVTNHVDRPDPRDVTPVPP